MADAGLGYAARGQSGAGLGDDQPMTMADRHALYAEFRRQGMNDWQALQALKQFAPPQPPPEPPSQTEIEVRANRLRNKLDQKGYTGTDVEHKYAEKFREKYGEYPHWYRPPGLMRGLFGNKNRE